MLDPLKVAQQFEAMDQQLREIRAEREALRAERDAMREALGRILGEDYPAVMDGIALNALKATTPTQGDRDDKE